MIKRCIWILCFPYDHKFLQMCKLVVLPFLLADPLVLRSLHLQKTHRGLHHIRKWRFYVFVCLPMPFLACPKNYNCNWKTPCGAKSKKKSWYALISFRVFLSFNFTLQKTQIYHCCDRNLVGLHALYHHFEQEHIHYDPRVKKISRYRAPSAQVAFDTFYAPRLFPHPAPFDLRRAPPDKFLAACERYGPIQDLIEPLQPLPDWFQSPARPPTTDDATKTAAEGTPTKKKTGSDPSQGNGL